MNSMVFFWRLVVQCCGLGARARFGAAALAASASACRRSASMSSASAVLSVRPAHRVGALAAQEGDALDQLRPALQQQQREAHRQRRPHGPADQAARVARHFARLVHLHHHGHRQVEHRDAQRREEEREADDVDPHLLALGQAAVEHVDAHVLPMQQRVAGGDQERPGEQVPLHFEEGVGTGVEDLAHDRVEGADHRGGQDQPDGVFAHLGVEPVDGPGQLEQALHYISIFVLDASRYDGTRRTGLVCQRVGCVRRCGFYRCNGKFLEGVPRGVGWP
jgi:hypothetical protein